MESNGLHTAYGFDQMCLGACCMNDLAGVGLALGWEQAGAKQRVCADTQYRKPGQRKAIGQHQSQRSGGQQTIND